MRLANADQKDTDTALAIGGILNDLDDCNSTFRHCSIRTLEFIDDPDAEEQAENPLEDFDPEDGEHCKILVDRLLKLLDRSPGCLNRVLWGYSSIRDNRLIDLDSDHLTFHPEIVAAKEKAAHYDTVRTALEVITHVVGHNDCSDGQTPNGFVVALEKARSALQHTPDTSTRYLIEAFITPSDPASQSGPTKEAPSDALQLALGSLQFFVDQCRGDTGTAKSHWEQFPEYRHAVSLLRLCTTSPVVPKTEVLIKPSEQPANLVQVGDLWVCEEEDAQPDQIPFALLIQCSSAEQCRAAMKAGTVQFTQFAHYTTQNGPKTS